MLSILAFVLVMFGSLNWLCIGFFQYDIVAGLFGYQGSIFSRIIYIVVGICAIYLIFVIIKNKGRLTVKKLKKQEQPIVDKMTDAPPQKLERDQQIANQIEADSIAHNQHLSQSNNTMQTSDTLQTNSAQTNNVQTGNVQTTDVQHN